MLPGSRCSCTAMATYAPTDPEPSSSPVPTAGNASGVLTVFGLILVLAGLGCGVAMAGYVLLLPSLLPPGPAAETVAMQEASRPVMILTTVFYGVLGLAVVWLGIGSIRARRWAWKTALASGWLLVALVVLTGVSYSFILPRIMGNMAQSVSFTTGGLPPSLLTALSFVGLFIGLLFYATPGIILIVVYSLRNVRLTCERRDPGPCWTDRVPLPVLAFWLLMFSSLSAFLVFSPVYLGWMKSPGMSDLLPQPARFALWGGGVPMLAWACRDLARMNPRGWWLSLAICLAGCLGAIWFGANYDLLEVIRAMQVPEESLLVYQSFEKGAMLLPAATSGILLLGYVIWLKRFFPSPAIA